MIQFNLLPDVKLEYIRAQRSKQLVFSVAFIVSVAAVGLLGLLLLTNLAQKKHINDMTADITSKSASLKGKKDIGRILTVQNQLNALTKLHTDKPSTARVFDYLNKTTPTVVDITNFAMDMTAQTVTVTGTADKISSVNQYADTLKYTTYKSGDQSAPAFKDVVLSSIGLSGDKTRGHPISYTITFSYDPLIFSNTEQPTLNVPNRTTTRADANEAAGDLFQSAPAATPVKEAN